MKPSVKVWSGWIKKRITFQFLLAPPIMIFFSIEWMNGNTVMWKLYPIKWNGNNLTNQLMNFPYLHFRYNTLFAQHLHSSTFTHCSLIRIPMILNKIWGEYTKIHISFALTRVQPPGRKFELSNFSFVSFWFYLFICGRTYTSTEWIFIISNLNVELHLGKWLSYWLTESLMYTFRIRKYSFYSFQKFIQDFSSSERINTNILINFCLNIQNGYSVELS